MACFYPLKLDIYRLSSSVMNKQHITKESRKINKILFANVKTAIYLDLTEKNIYIFWTNNNCTQFRHPSNEFCFSQAESNHIEPLKIYEHWWNYPDKARVAYVTINNFPTWRIRVYFSDKINENYIFILTLYHPIVRLRTF